jgi:adenine phosphoribosyltransferase
LGLVELRKDPDPSADSERWLTTRTPPDYQDWNLALGLRRDLLSPTARALFVDDWIDTGDQAVDHRRRRSCPSSSTVIARPRTR